MRIVREQSVAVIVDVQERLFPVMHGNEELSDRLSRLIRGYRTLDLPILMTQQYTKGLGPTIEPIREAAGEIDPIEKMSFSCCDEQRFMDALEALGRDVVIISGIEAHVCVLQTSMDLLDRGLTPVVVADAVSSRAERDRDVALRRMEGAGVVLTTYESILFELTRVSGSDTFKAISKLVK